MSDQSTAAKPWEPPTSDQEFVFESVDALPAWADKSWATAGGIAVPHGPVDRDMPYTTDLARKGDTVKYSVKTASFTVVPAEPAEDAEPPKRAAQVSNASLEDQLRNEAITPADLDDDAKAQVASRTPALKKVLEEGA